jgi:hypothetical protein
LPNGLLFRTNRGLQDLQNASVGTAQHSSQIGRRCPSGRRPTSVVTISTSVFACGHTGAVFRTRPRTVRHSQHRCGESHRISLPSSGNLSALRPQEVQVPWDQSKNVWSLFAESFSLSLSCEISSIPLESRNPERSSFDCLFFVPHRPP